MPSRLWLLCLALVVASLLASCGGTSKDVTPTSTAAPPASPGATIVAPTTTAPTPIPLPSSAQISAPSPDVLWVLMGSEALFLSRDHGQTWSTATKAPGPVSFIDDHEGWALNVDFNGDCPIPHLFSTADAGTNWSEVPTTGLDAEGCNGDTHFSDTLFVDATQGFLSETTNSAVLVYASSDGGRAWVPSELPVPAQAIAGRLTSHSIQLQVSAGQAVAVAQFSTPDGSSRLWAVYRQGVAGKWMLQAAFPNSGTFALVSPTRWLQLGAGGPSSETTDGGLTWHDFKTDYGQAAPIAPQVVFAGTSLGYASMRGSIQRTEDGGAHWTSIGSPGTSP